MKLKAFLTGFSAVAILLVSGCSNSHSASKESNVEKETSASVSNDIEFGKDEDGKPLFFSDIYGSRKDSKIDYNVGYNAYMGQKTTYIDSLHVEKNDDSENDDGNYRAATSDFKSVVNYDYLKDILIDKNVTIMPDALAKQANFEKSTKTVKGKSKTTYNIEMDIDSSKKHSTELAHVYLPIIRKTLIRSKEIDKALTTLEKAKFDSFSYEAKVDAKTKEVTYFNIDMNTTSDDGASMMISISYDNKKTSHSFEIPSYVKENSEKISKNELEILQNI
ncbi:hypothetical protein [Lactobacillus hominis]|uniref:Lipoprotein n=1 Tax=Lactobacillus hominis DSM 23910 = CRBIP 24.179 TaxID=1423758 RepID=I7L7A5_9LACO|nr:hypothetical protein [Lactobacillus hominis]KRM85137.1 hypothetical protein FC41_GL001516 [Lactobacillus hominis DSM 23910 = CRBIP 24.179]MCT3348297.1 hypothetical protein [Lactobacillus hominis]CCI82497.1 Protein of unknown function [Lactobacillus hominis DSM 23910 = CRBIP 24.179]